MAAKKKTIITNELRELLCQRFRSMTTKFYGKQKQSTADICSVTSGQNYVEADFTTLDKKKCQLAVTLKYFQENTQEIYDTIKNPSLVNKPEFICELI